MVSGASLGLTVRTAVSGLLPRVATVTGATALCLTDMTRETRDFVPTSQELVRPATASRARHRRPPIGKGDLRPCPQRTPRVCLWG